MEKSTFTRLLFANATDISPDGITKMSETITEYGVMVVLCAVFILISVVLFSVFIKRYAKDDDARTQCLVDTVNMLRSMKENNFNVASSFDKHNMIATQEFKAIETEIKDVLESILDNDGNLSKMKREVDLIMEIVNTNQNDIKLELNSLRHDINQLSKAIDKLADKFC